MGIGTTEIILIFVFVLIFFGAKRLPEIARSLGKGIREFKKATGEIKDSIKIDEISDSKPNNKESGDKNEK